MSAETVTMPYRMLGKSGLKVSALSFGSWVTFNDQFSEITAREIMQAAKERGVNFFDTAEGYSSGQAEVLMGQAIKKLGWKRSDLVLSTKIYFGGDGPNDVGLSRKHIIEGVQASLKRLDQAYVDVVFCHRPDPLTPIEETVRAMNFVLDKGWAFYWGTSEWNAKQLLEAHEIAQRLNLVPPVVEQPQYNMFCRDFVEGEYESIYPRGLGLTTWSPLASGILTGKYKDGHIPEGSRLSLPNYRWLAERKLNGKQDELQSVERLRPIAETLGCTLAQLAIAWCLRNPHVSTVITGASRVSQLHENIDALKFVDKLTDPIMAQIDEILKNKPVDDDRTAFVKTLRHL